MSAPRHSAPWLNDGACSMVFAPRLPKFCACFCVLLLNATAGSSSRKYASHSSTTFFGTRSILFSNNTTRFVAPIFRTNRSTSLHLVPIGSRASSTSMITSDASTTLAKSL